MSTQQELYERIATAFAELDATKKAEIDAMTHEALCRRWRFAPLGDTFWQGEPGKYAEARLFKHFGGFTPAISKRIGWGDA